MKIQRNPTPYAEVNEILNLLLSNVPDILGDQFVGMYLYGSLANGDFDRYSDIDILVVTKQAMSDDHFLALQSMHTQIAALDNWYASQLEVSYIPKDALRRYNAENSRHPHLDRGERERLHVIQHETDWIVQRYILRERGMTLVGPEPNTLIDPVSADDLRKAMQAILFGWYAHFLEKPAPFDSRGYQSYTVLSLCRILYTLQQGEVVSKMAAADWARENLDPRWLPLIERARIGRQNSGLDPEPKDVRETLEMIRYALHSAKPTPYLDVNQRLNLLLANVKKIMGDQFVGMYLYGSLSGGDFNSETSDIDFLVVTNSTLSDPTVTELETMHRAMWATGNKWFSKLEGSYVPQALIRRHDPNGSPCPTVNEGRFFVEKRGSDWIIQRHVIREFGVIVEGPDPKTLIDAVSPDELRGAVLGLLEEWWFPMLYDPSWLLDHGDEYHAFAVITMCRVLHALEHGTIVSKPKAVEWARKKLGNPWLVLIDKAVAASHHQKQEDFLDETLDFVRFVKTQVMKPEAPPANGEIDGA